MYYSMLLKEKTNENNLSRKKVKNDEKNHEICLHTSMLNCYVV